MATTKSDPGGNCATLPAAPLEGSPDPIVVDFWQSSEPQHPTEIYRDFTQFPLKGMGKRGVRAGYVTFLGKEIPYNYKGWSFKDGVEKIVEREAEVKFWIILATLFALLLSLGWWIMKQMRIEDISTILLCLFQNA